MNQHDNEPIFQEVRKGDVPHSNADISLAKSILSYSPTVSFQEGLERTIQYYF
jgi:nucleoside-diphosphate-sugar epimerase